MRVALTFRQSDLLYYPFVSITWVGALARESGAKSLCKLGLTPIYAAGRTFYWHGGRTMWPKHSDRVAQSVRADGTSVLGCTAVSL